jgi:hypothetical protein
MPRSRRIAISGRRDNSSTDREVRANEIYLAATCHLSDNSDGLSSNGNLKEQLTF